MSVIVAVSMVLSSAGVCTRHICLVRIALLVPGIGSEIRVIAIIRKLDGTLVLPHQFLGMAVGIT